MLCCAGAQWLPQRGTRSCGGAAPGHVHLHGRAAALPLHHHHHLHRPPRVRECAVLWGLGWAGCVCGQWEQLPRCQVSQLPRCQVPQLPRCFSPSQEKVCGHGHPVTWPLRTGVLKTVREHIFRDCAVLQVALGPAPLPVYRNVPVHPSRLLVPPPGAAFVALSGPGRSSQVPSVLLLLQHHPHPAEGLAHAA